MYRLIAIVFISLFLASVSYSQAIPVARPRSWIARHKRFLLMEGAAIGAASIHAAGLHHCRRANGVEACDAHYGAAWAAFGFTTGLTVIAMPAIAEGCWKSNDDDRFCNIFAYSGSVAQAGWGIHEWTIDKPQKPNLSQVEIIKH